MDLKPASGQVESPGPFVIFVCLLAVMVFHVLTAQIFVLLFSFAAGYLTMWRQSEPRSSVEAEALGYPALA